MGALRLSGCRQRVNQPAWNAVARHGRLLGMWRARSPSQARAARRRAGAWPWLPLSGLLHVAAVSGWFWSSRAPLEEAPLRTRPPAELAIESLDDAPRRDEAAAG